MGFYNYKRVFHRDDFAAEAEKYAAEEKAAGGEYEGTCDYDGDGWIVAARLLDAKDAEIKRLRSERMALDAMYGDAIREKDAQVDRAISLYARAVTLETAIRGFRAFGEGLARPFGRRSRHVITAGKILIDMADKALARFSLDAASRDPSPSHPAADTSVGEDRTAPRHTKSAVSVSEVSVPGGRRTGGEP